MFRRVSLRRRLVVLAAMLLWMGFVLYPQPRALFLSAKRLVRPPVDAQAVTELAGRLPDDPAVIEAFSQANVRYVSSWKLYGTPWYFPTVREVIRDRAGDCQAEAILTASILEAKGLPYTLRYSFDHVWVDYPGKQPNELEDPALSFLADDGTGWLGALPDRLPLRDIVEQRVRYHWEPMPAARKWALLGGLVLLLGLAEGAPGALVERFRRPAARPLPDS